jgi:hypothetical protein
VPYTFALVAQFLSIITRGVRSSTLVPDATAVVVLLPPLTAVVIFCKPLRNPLLSFSDISPIGATPSIPQRSPEDNLQLWQFLTISWLLPLLGMGTQRQLNEEDVWSLGFGFQHTTLHNKFRHLQGSVGK